MSSLHRVTGVQSTLNISSNHLIRQRKYGDSLLNIDRIQLAPPVVCSKAQIQGLSCKARTPLRQVVLRASEQPIKKPPTPQNDDDDDDFDVLGTGMNEDMELPKIENAMITPSKNKDSAKPTSEDSVGPLMDPGDINELMREAAADTSGYATEDAVKASELFMAQQSLMEDMATADKAGVPDDAVMDNQVEDTTDIDDDQAKALCREIVEVLKVLQETRDMSMREVILVLQIEDPITRENRRAGFIKGVSRQAVADALSELSEGKIPKSRDALVALHTELVNWPYLYEVEAPKDQEEEADEGTQGGLLSGKIRPDQQSAPQARLWDKNESGIPTVFGYSILWFVTLLPVLFVGIFFALVRSAA